MFLYLCNKNDSNEIAKTFLFIVRSLGINLIMEFSIYRNLYDFYELNENPLFFEYIELRPSSNEQFKKGRKGKLGVTPGQWQNILGTFVVEKGQSFC